MWNISTPLQPKVLGVAALEGQFLPEEQTYDMEKTVRFWLRTQRPVVFKGSEQNKHGASVSKNQFIELILFLCTKCIIWMQYNNGNEQSERSSYNRAEKILLDGYRLIVSIYLIEFKITLCNRILNNIGAV